MPPAGSTENRARGIPTTLSRILPSQHPTSPNPQPSLDSFDSLKSWFCSGLAATPCVVLTNTSPLLLGSHGKAALFISKNFSSSAPMQNISHSLGDFTGQNPSNFVMKVRDTPSASSHPCFKFSGLSQRPNGAMTWFCAHISPKMLPFVFSSHLSSSLLRLSHSFPNAGERRARSSLFVSAKTGVAIPKTPTSSPASKSDRSKDFLEGQSIVIS